MFTGSGYRAENGKVRINHENGYDKFSSCYAIKDAESHLAQIKKEAALLEKAIEKAKQQLEVHRREKSLLEWHLGRVYQALGHYFEYVITLNKQEEWVLKKEPIGRPAGGKEIGCFSTLEQAKEAANAHNMSPYWEQWGN